MKGNYLQKVPSILKPYQKWINMDIFLPPPPPRPDLSGANFLKFYKLLEFFSKYRVNLPLLGVLHIGESKKGAPGTSSPRSNVLFLCTFWGKIGQNNRLTLQPFQLKPLLWEILDPPLLTANYSFPTSCKFGRQISPSIVLPSRNSMSRTSKWLPCRNTYVSVSTPEIILLHNIQCMSLLLTKNNSLRNMNR